ncbi:MAG TPA: glycosyltransferase family 4 protein [Pyrinomonadaceae bacterium]|jgi:glycosyltransferase involved in cell wall biosynthesis|nr:glycosyltransferase family 4 protein [Pyrinomonadaceae bacterium]
MHVAFLTTEYPPRPSGGIGTSIRNVARALAAQGHGATVLVAGAGAAFDDRGVSVRFAGETNVPKVGWLWDARNAQRALNDLIRRDGVDVVEAHDWCGPSAGLRLDRPLSVRCHGAATYFAHLLDESVRPTVRWTETLALRGADDVVAVSRFTADVTRRLFRLRSEVGVIPNGIDAAQFTPAEAGEAEPDTILYFGTLARKKGVLDLCRIFSLVAERRPRARLRFVGRDAPDARTGARSTQALCQESLSPAARGRVEFLGAQPHDRVQEHVRRAALCVFPSYAEAFPLAWLEAMACAKAVVAYDTGWAREVVREGESGVLVPAGDTRAFARAVEELLSDEGARVSLGREARARVESCFTSDMVARRSVEHYRRLLRA